MFTQECPENLVSVYWFTFSPCLGTRGDGRRDSKNTQEPSEQAKKTTMWDRRYKSHKYQVRPLRFRHMFVFVVVIPNGLVVCYGIGSLLTGLVHAEVNYKDAGSTGACRQGRGKVQRNEFLEIIISSLHVWLCTPFCTVDKMSFCRVQLSLGAQVYSSSYPPSPLFCAMGGVAV